MLMDHSELVQSADGLEDAKILSIVDHHKNGSVSTGNQLIYDARPVGASSTIVWLRYRPPQLFRRRSRQTLHQGERQPAHKRRYGTRRPGQLPG